MKPHIRLGYAFAMLLVVAGMSACSHRTGGIMASTGGITRVDNSSVGSDVSISELKTRLIGGMMQGIATITSLDSTDLSLQYQFTWFDGSGFVIEGDSSSWTPLTLYGKQQVQVQAMAPANGAVSFEIYVREVFSQ
ncbi:DUF1425 domain-containing protein [Shewanella sp. SNU WT4]|uniref:YcfL family protein n=1 Tax=Shewanella sp. SNU WT4 TaxID=2590015 RepID=UPI00112C33BC|nr:YcfL family protein [Shewanella sp. SNU WT4]QDF66790.1 DUF1425 domain-containing protein [Shewanella sp. SNU WT4]